MDLLTTCPEHYCEDSSISISIRNGVWISDVLLPLICINPTDIMQSLLHGQQLGCDEQDPLFTEDIQIHTSRTLYHVMSTLLGLPSCGVKSISAQDLFLRLVALGEQIVREVCGEVPSIPHVALAYQLRDSLLAQSEEALKGRIDNLQYVLRMTSSPPDSVIWMENKDWIVRMTADKVNLPSRIRKLMVVNRHFLVYVQNCRKWTSRGLGAGGGKLSVTDGIITGPQRDSYFLWSALENAIRSGSVMCVRHILDFIRENTTLMVVTGDYDSVGPHCTLDLLPEKSWRLACSQGRYLVIEELFRQVRLAVGEIPLCDPVSKNKTEESVRPDDATHESKRWSLLHCLLTGMESYDSSISGMSVSRDGSPSLGSERSMGCYMYGSKHKGTFGKNGRERDAIYMLIEKLQYIEYFIKPIPHTAGQERLCAHAPKTLDSDPPYPFSVVDLLALRGLWPSVEHVVKNKAIPFYSLAGTYAIHSDDKWDSICCTSTLLHCAVLEGRPNILGENEKASLYSSSQTYSPLV